MIPPRVQLRDVSWDAARRLVQSWIDGVQAVLNGGATLSETMAGEVRRATFNSDSPPTVTTRSPAKPVAVLCLAAKRTGTSQVVVSGYPISWTWTPGSSGGAFVINAVVGAVDGVDYALTLWISEG